MPRLPRSRSLSLPTAAKAANRHAEDPLRGRSQERDGGASGPVPFVLVSGHGGEEGARAEATVA
jgi:hypothetical protein